MVLAAEDVDRAGRDQSVQQRTSYTPLNWADLLKSERVLIISQAGSGKTFECRAQQRRLWAEGEAAFMLELAVLARGGVGDQLDHEEEVRLEQWRLSQSDIATFFLDSIDELELTHGSFRVALKKLARTIGGQLARVRVVITSRPVPFERELVASILPVPPRRAARLTSDEFAEAAMGEARKEAVADKPPNTLLVELLPLSDEQIVLFASGQGVEDPDAFLADIRRRGIIEFAERPQDLIELCMEWRERHRVGSHKEQVAGAIKTKLLTRTGRGERAELSPEQAHEGASRLALAAMLMRRLIFRHSTEADVGGPAGTAIDPADILENWTPDERRTLLERPLFGFASYGRVRFHHRSVLEYLAAQRLALHLATGKPISTVKRLLLVETAQGEKVVRPAMRPVAAWLALENDSIFAAVIERDPAIMLDLGDPGSLSDGQKERALTAYVSRYGRGGWRGLHVPSLQVRRFASPGLGPLVRRLWPGVENAEVRELLLDLVGTGRIRDCAGLAVEAALARTEPSQVRMGGLHALIEMSDPGLQEVVRSLEDDPDAWPMETARAAVVRLFPGHVTVQGLLAILSRLTERRGSVGYMTYHLPQRIVQMEGTTDLDALVQCLSALVGEGVTWTHEWPPCRSPRAFLLPALAAACARRMLTGPFSPDLAEAVALALRLADHTGESDQHVKALRQQVAELGVGDRAMLFWTEDRYRQLHHPVTEPGQRFWQAARHGPIRLDPKRDAAWLHAGLSDTARPVSERAVMLLGLLQNAWDGQGTWDGHLQRVQAEMADSTELTAMADRLLTLVPPDPELVAQEANWKKREAEQAEEHAKAVESWKGFQKELADDPEAAFTPQRRANTAWNLWRAMKRSAQEGHTAGWDRRFLETQFDAAMAVRMRDALRPVWRDDRPTLWSERPQGKRNTYLARWEFGLAAVAAEAEDRSWAAKLTSDEAKLACRYVLIQLNGLPGWLDDLAAAHPVEVQEVLGGELEAELGEAASAEGSGLLSSIGYSSARLKDLFRPKLLAWLGADGDLVRDEDAVVADDARLETVLDILTQGADDTTREHLRKHACCRLGGGAVGRATVTWLATLLRLDPEEGVTALERTLGELPPAKSGHAVDLLGHLFGDRGSTRPILTSEPGFSPALLLRLVTLAYQHVRIADDDRHEGTYTPDSRDHAQHARNAVLEALLRARGADGWEAKLALAGQPWFAHMRNRVLRIARDLAAEEADGQPATAAAVVSLERHGDMPPATRDDMFQLMEDRLDDLDDLLRQDASPREGWAAVKDERVIRRLIAHELERDARGAYRIDQEAVTADEKETDIRFRSSASQQEGVIEVKVGEKPRSAADLRRALSEQLVRKYMAPETRRAGVLLVTLAKDRRWEHPDTGEMIDLGGLIAMLNEEARRITEGAAGALRVSARGLDLRPRLTSERAGMRPRTSMRKTAPRA